MSFKATDSVRWLDFSGAPPIIIPQRLVALWRGAMDPATGEWVDSVEWYVKEQDLVLMNSAADGAMNVQGEDFLPIRLPLGRYTVEYSRVVFMGQAIALAPAAPHYPQVWPHGLPLGHWVFLVGCWVFAVSSAVELHIQ